MLTNINHWQKTAVKFLVFLFFFISWSQIHAQSCATVNTVANQTVCNNGATTLVTFTSPTTGGTIVYNWVNNITSIGLAASGTGNIASFNGINNTSAPVTATVTVTPRYSSGITYNFTNSKAAGIAGPSQAQVNTEYTGTSLDGKVTANQGIQQWTVPVTGLYTLTTAGASGGHTPQALGGKGRVITTQVNLTAGQVLTILVGQEGGRAAFNSPGYAGGGGGGTFVINQTTNTPILISGGGGGAAEGNSTYGSPIFNGKDASLYNLTSGGDGYGFYLNDPENGFGGTNGSGGTKPGSGGAGGGGYLGDGEGGSQWGGNPGLSFGNGGLGGSNINYGSGTTLNIDGGFGGGAGAGTNRTYVADAGGGGGYSGGGGSGTTIGTGGGGGNWFSGNYISDNLNIGNGYVNISFGTSGSTCDGTATTFTYTVNPTATVNTVPNQTVCNTGATTAVTFSSPTTDGEVVYSWTNDKTSIGLAASGTGNIPSFSATNGTSAPVTATITVTPNYGSKIYNFTNSKATGISGPSQAQVTTEYSGTSLAGNVTVIGQGIQQWTVPVSGLYTLTTAGASGGHTPQALGGKGRIITTKVNLIAGDVLNILVGQEGGRAEFSSPDYGGGYVGGGGGGTFVINQTTNTSILISGGGGGAAEGSAQVGSPVLNGIDASAYNVTSGGDGIGYNQSWSVIGMGGTAGSGGTKPGGGGAGGGGYLGDGQGGTEYGGNPGLNYANGGLGGINRNYYGGTTLDIPGGFGGGAGAGTHTNYEANGGGGGGYSGGGGSNSRVGAGGGGGNLFTGTYVSSGLNTGNGFVNLAQLTPCDGTATTFTYIVNQGPNVIATPASQTICSATAITPIVLTSSTAGTPFSWTRNNGTTVTGMGANGSGSTISGSLTNTTNAPITVTFTITPGANGCVGPTTTATVTVNPTIIVNAVTNQTVCNTGTTTGVTFSSPTTGGTVVYNWTNDKTSIGLAATGSGDIAAFTVTNTSSTAIIATITVTPSYTNGTLTCTGSAKTFTITVNPPATVNVVANQTVCNNSATTAVTFSGSVPGITSFYTVSNNNNKLSTVPTSTYQATKEISATLAGYTVQGMSSIAYDSSTTKYYVIVTVSSSSERRLGTINPSTGVITDIGSLGDRFSSIAIAPNGKMWGVKGQNSNCPGCLYLINKSTALPTYIRAIPNGSDGQIIQFNSKDGFLYHWSNRINIFQKMDTLAYNVTSIANQSSNDIITGSFYNYSTGNFTINDLSGYVYEMSPTGTKTDLGNTKTVSGALLYSRGFVNAGSSTVYNWTNNITSIGLAATGSGDIASFPATNTTSAPVTATITVTPSYNEGSNTCTGTARTFTYTVSPTATVNTVANQTVCNSAATTGVTFSSSTTGGTIVYNWINDKTSIGLAASGTGNISSFTANNTTSAPVTATITVTPSYTKDGITCTGTAKTFTITVNPIAKVNPVANQTLCNTAATTAITFSSPTPGGTIVYNWTNDKPSIGLAASGIGDIGSFIASNTSAAPVTATIIVTPSFTTGNSCAGIPQTFTITVNTFSTAPTSATTSASLLCAVGGTVTLSAQGGVLGTGAVYKWFTSNCGGTLVGTGATLNVSLNVTTTYFVRIEGTCNTTNCASVTVTVAPQPVVVITATASTISTPATPVVFYTTVSPVGNYTFQWFRNGVILPTSTGQTLKVPVTDGSGTYSAIVSTVGSGCTATSNSVKVRDSVIAKMMVIPNPNIGVFKVSVYAAPQDLGSERKVIVYDGNGARVFSKTYKVVLPYDLIDVDIHQHAGGIYSVRVVNAAGKELSSAQVMVLK